MINRYDFDLNDDEKNILEYILYKTIEASKYLRSIEQRKRIKIEKDTIIINKEDEMNLKILHSRLFYYRGKNEKTQAR